MSDYVFNDDSDEATEYLKALQESEKDGQKKSKKNFDNERIEFFFLKEKEKANFRVVQIPGNKTRFNQKIHFMKGLGATGITIPSKLVYLTCTEDKNTCLGEKCKEYAANLKKNYEFSSDENKALFKAECSVEPTPVMNVVGIDRRDGKVKIFQVNKPTTPDFLELFEEGNPAHPETGYDIEVTRKDKKTYKLKKLKTSPLSTEEVKTITSIKDPFSFVRYKASPEYHNRLGITFGDQTKGNSEEAASKPVNANEDHSKVALGKVDLPSETEDDLPF
jgi:hypothetical protein